MSSRGVRLSVTFVDHVKMLKHIFEIPSGSHTILVFPYQTGWRYSDWNPPNGGVECRWGIGRNRDSGLIAGYGRLLDVRSVKNIYGRRSWVYDTVGHAPLAIDMDCWTCELRSDKNSYRRPCSVDRTVGDAPWNECLFVTACSMDQYAKEKTTEKNIIVRSGISEAETTNNKRLSSTLCIEAIQTRSIARPLCDSRASCLYFSCWSVNFNFNYFLFLNKFLNANFYFHQVN